jgi:hypothetical protein
MSNRLITPRRILQQIVHCCNEALSVYENDEDIRNCLDDLNDARDLINFIITDRILPQIEALDSSLKLPKVIPTPPPGVCKRVK